MLFQIMLSAWLRGSTRTVTSRTSFCNDLWPCWDIVHQFNTRTWC